ncbi:NYN domain protein [Peptostreptococcaceae bacterium AS15]|nr:NYN domain protein [Peptostreptococcaceae bacterium AS15]
MDDQKKYAVLIDAENIAYKYVKYIMGEMANYGVVTYKRAYMDWSAQNATGWKSVLLENAISPVQSIAYTSGKNSTDSTIIIDAMDILYSKTVGGFCIVSSDSDFTKLATRLRESGMTVIGMGESKTPKAFIEACNSFKVLNLVVNKEEIEKSDKLSKSEELQKNKDSVNTDKKAITPLSEIKNAIKNIIINKEGKGEDVEAGELGRLLNNRYSEFDTRNYGYSKLSVMLKDMDFLNLVETNNRIYIRLKGNAEIESINQKIVEILIINGGIVPLSRFAQLIKDRYPNFNTKDYGYSQFKKMIESIPQINVNKQNATLVRKSNKKETKEDIKKSIIEMLSYSNNVMNISQINQNLIKLHPSFTAKKYGYSKFSEVLKDIPQIKIKNDNAILYDEENLLKSKKKIEELIIKIIEKNGGRVKIGSIKNELKKIDSNFDQKNYGHSKFTKFIESLESIKLIDEDMVLAKVSDLGDINTEKMGEKSDVKTDTISEISTKNETTPEINVDSNKISNAEKTDIREIRNFISNMISKNNNMMNIGMIKENLVKTYPNFNLQDYDCSSFKVFLESMEGFKIIENNANID